MEHLTAFLTRMPKVELHVHLESTMPWCRKIMPFKKK